MSNRQIKKILAKNQKEENYSSEEEAPPKVNFFTDVDIEDIESEEESQITPQATVSKPANESSKNNKGKKALKVEKVKEEKDFDFNFETSLENIPQQETKKIDSVFKRQKKYFDSRTETDKLFQNNKKGHKIIHQSGKGHALTPTFTSQAKVDYLLSMEKVSDPTRNIFFFDISKGYSKIHPNYTECIESNDENLLNQFLARYPFHIESLFQMVMVFQMQGNFENVSHLLERLLYSFQLSFHYQFSVISNDAEIDITMNNYNRIFLKTLMMHADCLGRKGCVRTALEVVKLIFSLSSRDDSLGCIFLIDYYSIRAKKFNYFFHFIEHYMSEVYGHGSTLEFPHLVYSYALAKGIATGYFGCDENDIKASESVQSLSDLLVHNSSVILLCAINWHPEIAQILLQKVTDPSKKLENCSKTSEIYAKRNEEIWKPHCKWLKLVMQNQTNVPTKECNFEGIMDKYSSIDSSDFSFDVRTVIPQDMEIQQRRHRGNLSSASSPWYLFFATFLPWNYID